MKTVFADSVYFFALVNARDTFHPRAAEFSARSENPFVTTAWIITEVADGLCARATRETVIRLLDILQSSADVEIVPPSAELFQQGLERYRQRPDKNWSLTDCISFLVMEQRGITEALTADHHFQQAGFSTLLA
jgi:predicted nucleic acid-binding protein